MSSVRLAFSTLGVPGLALDGVLDLATAHGFHGVELRARAGEPVTTKLSTAERRAIVERFTEAGVAPITVAAYTRVAVDGDDDPLVEEAREHIRLAADLGAPFVRVFPGGAGLSTQQADDNAVRRLNKLAPFAADLGVRVLMETHDSHSRAADAARVLSRVDHAGTGLIWDVMHTWRGGEAPAESFAAAAAHLGYVQVKDIESETETTPLPLGEGVLPLPDCIAVLSAGGYTGWLCWEYEAAWYPDAAPYPPLLTGARRYLHGLING